MSSTLNAAIGAAASALTVERTRVEVAVSNLANAESTRGPNGQPYRRREVLLETAPGKSFDNALGQAVGVRVSAVVEDPSPYQTRYDPTHLDADEAGFVSLPNVRSDEEVVDLLSASRAYQANLTAINVIRDMIQKALDLGRS
jgi:flagellar basal-body rod protein FlgC